MPTYAQLYHRDLKPLKDSHEEWATAARKMSSTRTSFRTRVKTNFEKAGWASTGPDPANAKGQMDSVYEELDHASATAEGNAKILEDAYAELRARQKELKRLAEEEAPKMGLFVEQDGTVVPRDPIDDHPGARNDPETGSARQEEQERVNQLSSDITRVLNQAEEIDISTARALDRNAGESNTRFNKAA